jgi:DNA protecting protein DprA
MIATNPEQLRQIRGIGDVRYRQITARLDQEGQTVDALFKMDAQAIKAAFKLPINVAQAIFEYGQKSGILESPTSQIKRVPEHSDNPALASKNIHLLTRQHTSYPEKLLDVLGEKAPPVMYVWGNLDLLAQPAVGFCGSRAVSAKGLSVVEDVVRQISARGWVTVSGHAKGVDATAHRVALDSGASTIIVAAEGLLTFRLRQEIKRIASPEQILIVSEYQPEDRWTTGRAMQRNKTIIGLSDALVLIESRMEGGTFDAGRNALRLQRPLFVAQYEMSAEHNAGNAYFLDRGATALMRNAQTGRANLEQLEAIVLAATNA